MSIEEKWEELEARLVLVDGWIDPDAILDEVHELTRELALAVLEEATDNLVRRDTLRKQIEELGKGGNAP